MSTCTYCAEPLPDGKETWIKCPICTTEVKWNSVACSGCRRLFYDDDWEYFEQLEARVPINPLTLDKDHMLCCDKDYKECTCDQELEWTDIYEIPTPLWDKIYEDEGVDNKCGGCAFYFEAGCIPLRIWARSILLNGNESPGLISDMCGNYLDMTEVPVGLLTGFVSY